MTSRFLALIAVLLTCAGVAHAQLPVGVTDTFTGCTTTNGLGQDWTTYGTWYCKDNRARGESFHGFALPNVLAVQNTDVRAFVQLNGDSNGSGLVARWVDTTHFYVARTYVNSSGPSFVTISRFDGTKEILLGTADAPVERNFSTSLRFIVTGTGTNVRLVAQVSGVTLIDVVDRSGALPVGRAGLFSSGAPSGASSRSQFDNYVMTGTEPSPGASFTDDFDECTSTSDLGSRWRVIGDWYCKAGRARGESSHGFAIANTPAERNVDVEALVQLNGDSSRSGIVARWRDESNYYAATVSIGVNGPEFVGIHRVDNGVVTGLGSIDYPIRRNFSNRLRLVVTDLGSGSTKLQLFVDGDLLIDATDTSGRRPDGFSGLISGGPSRSQFDSFQMNSL